MRREATGLAPAQPVPVPEVKINKFVRQTAFGLCLFLCFSGGCGTVGPPVAPEYVGIGAKLQKDTERERAKEEERRKALEQPGKQPAESAVPEIESEKEAEEGPPPLPPEEEVTLPPLRPIGTAR